MAAPSRQRCIRQALQEMVTCPMCRGRLEAPRLLRCRHSACFRCLDAWHRSGCEGRGVHTSPAQPHPGSSSDAGGADENEAGADAEADDPDAVSCPTCRALTLLPPGGSGVEALPGDFNKNILLDILDMADEDGALPGSSRSWCTVCDITGRRGVGAKTPAIAFCSHCSDHLCAPCLEEHNALRLLAAHSVTVTPHGSHLSVLMCREHRNKSLDFFCHNCAKLICNICLRTQHRDHLAEGANDVSESRKRDLAGHKKAIMTRLKVLKADGRAFNIDRRAGAKQRIASFQCIRRNSFDIVSAVTMLGSLVQLCDYLLTRADPGEVVAAAGAVRARAEQLLAETAPDAVTDRILDLLCRARGPPPEAEPDPVPNASRATGAGSLTSDDRSSDVTDDASFIGSDPGGAVTDLDENLEEVGEEEGDGVEGVVRGRDEGVGEGRVGEERRHGGGASLVEGPEVGERKPEVAEQRTEIGPQEDFQGEPRPADADPAMAAVRGGSSKDTTSPPRSDVTHGDARLLWRCSVNGPELGQVDCPWDVAFTADGDVITTEVVNQRVQVFSDDGRQARVLLSGFEPRGVTVAPDGTVAVVDHTRHCVHLVPPGGSAADARLWRPEHVAAPEVVAFAPGGQRVVTDAGKHVVAVYNADGAHLRTIGERGHGNGQFRQPLYVSVSAKGKIVVGDLHNNRIQAFTLDGRYLGKAGRRGAGDGSLFYPRGVCWDGADHVVVADSNNSRLTVFDHDGRWRRHLLTAQQGLRRTRGVSVTTTQGGATLVAVTDRDSELSSLTVWEMH